jgi:Flp pilus assembly protein TadB
MAPLPALAVPILCANLEGYAEFVFDRPAGNMVLAISAVLVAAGIILTQRLAQVELSAARRDA